MPIAKFKSADAIKNIRSDRAAQWPDGRKSSERLEGNVKISLKPGFTFSEQDHVFTIGSCFAREIEKYLGKLGFVLPALDISIPAEERSSDVVNDILNKYAVHSMENEIRWAFEDENIPEELFYLETGKDGLWHDPQLAPNIKPSSKERVIQRRKMVNDLLRRITDCRVIVITLGLAEAWFDTRTNLYLNGMPPKGAIDREPERFQLHILSHDDILDSLERIYSIISKHGHPDFRMLLTVSPVPFKASFSGRDALVANTYSKCVQRTAAEVFSTRHPNVDYFPSYEMVTLADRKVAFEMDNIHVTSETVAHIMSSVVNAYVKDFKVAATDVGEPQLPKSRTSGMNASLLRLRAKGALEAKDYDSAVALYSCLLFRFSSKMDREAEFDARLKLGIAMLGANLKAEGTAQLKLATGLTGNNPQAAYKLGVSLARVKMDQEALEMLLKASLLSPTEAEYHWRLGAQYIRMKNIGKGLESLRRAIALNPTHPDTLKLLVRYDNYTD